MGAGMKETKESSKEGAGQDRKGRGEREVRRRRGGFGSRRNKAGSSSFCHLLIFVGRTSCPSGKRPDGVPPFRSGEPRVYALTPGLVRTEPQQQRRDPTDEEIRTPLSQSLLSLSLPCLPSEGETQSTHAASQTSRRPACSLLRRPTASLSITSHQRHPTFPPSFSSLGLYIRRHTSTLVSSNCSLSSLLKHVALPEVDVALLRTRPFLHPAGILLLFARPWPGEIQGPR